MGVRIAVYAALIASVVIALRWKRRRTQPPAAPPPDQSHEIRALRAALATALREKQTLEREVECDRARDEALCRTPDKDATLRRIRAVIDKRTWPNNSDVAGSVEEMHRQLESTQLRCAEIERTLRLVEQGQ